MTQETIKLTMTQALVRFLVNQYIEIDGKKQRLCAGGFGIFGHGNVTCLGEALYENREALPLYRGQNEQSMALAAIGYAKEKLRQRFMFATSSAGPGTTNMLTAAALAHANRLPILFLSGDTFLTRLPDPVLQQLEHFNNPALGVNDAFKSVARYWDRITHPAQIIQSLPQAMNTLLDPADCGPAFLGLPQDVQGWTYDYPLSFFEERTHYIRRQAPDDRDIKALAQVLLKAEKPVLIAGGGIQYSQATNTLRSFIEAHNMPVIETIAGRANLDHGHPLNCGPVGVTGSDSANTLAEKADVIFAVGTRLQDFTTGSWTAFSDAAKLISLNVGRHDANKHLAVAAVGDAKLGLEALGQALQTYKAPAAWTAKAQEVTKVWDEYVEKNISPLTEEGQNRPMSYAQVVGVVNEMCEPRDRIVAAAGGLPAEVTANWRTKSIGTVDVEFGYSCMGYEIAGAWGARMAQMEHETAQDTICFCGDGSYLMMNSDIYSSVLAGHKLIILICDNGGFAVINKLQNNTGNASYNNLIADCQIKGEPFAVDFAAHAASMGAVSETIYSIDELRDAFQRAKAADKTYVISMQVDAFEGWTDQGHAWWEVGTPHTTQRDEVANAHKAIEDGRQKQRRGV